MLCNFQILEYSNATKLSAYGVAHYSNDRWSGHRKILCGAKEFVANPAARQAVGSESIYERTQERLWSAEKICRVTKRCMLREPFCVDQACFVIMFTYLVVGMRMRIKICVRMPLVRAASWRALAPMA